MSLRERTRRGLGIIRGALIWARTPINYPIIRQDILVIDGLSRGLRVELNARNLVEYSDAKCPHTTARRGRLVMSKALVLGVAALAFSAATASAQVYVSPGYGYGYDYGAPLYDYAAPVADLAPPAYGYAPPAPLYNYAAPAYGAPATAGTTVIIVNPAPAYTAPVYTAPPVASGYYNYAPGYGYGRWRAGYGWR
jgi:hypothetical protein